MRREKHKRPEPRGESTEAEDWGGLPCSSVEVSVMGTERRGRVTRGGVGRSTGDRMNLSVLAKAAAFNEWHEPDEARVSRPDL